MAVCDRQATQTAVRGVGGLQGVGDFGGGGVCPENEWGEMSTASLEGAAPHDAIPGHGSRPIAPLSPHSGG